jgi:hypothetical protein
LIQKLLELVKCFGGAESHDVHFDVIGDQNRARLRQSVLAKQHECCDVLSSLIEVRGDLPG